MKVLIACEYSGKVRDAFIALGHEAISCDLLPSDSDKGPHIQGDLFSVEDLHSFDLIIAHPPCTSLCVSGNRHYASTQARLDGAQFVKRIWDLPVERLCIENPVGVINTLLPDMPKPQYVQPWQFGHGETKKTGLWKRGLPDLVPTNIVDGRKDRIHKLPPSVDRWKIRSETYQGIADAMAKQWSIYNA
jgi:hypothetical protein